MPDLTLALFGALLTSGAASGETVAGVMVESVSAGFPGSATAGTVIRPTLAAKAMNRRRLMTGGIHLAWAEFS